MQRKDQFVVCPVKFTADTIVAVFHLLEDLLKAAKGYFFEKAALGVNHPRKFDKISVLKDEISGSLNLADECLDLAACSFCVHITGVHSPIAYAIVAETQWYSPDVSHGGIESVLRYSQQTEYIIGGIGGHW